MVNHYEVHVIFQDIEHQLQGNILQNFRLIFVFYEIFIKLRIIFDPLKIIYWKLLQHPNIEDMIILYLYHNLSCICY